MGNTTEKLKDDEIFYKSRVENLLGYSILCTQRNFSFAYIDSYGKPAKLKFSYKGYWKEFYYILIKSDPGKANWLTSALSSAVCNGNYLVSKVLLADQRVDPSDNDNEAIIWASSGGHLDIVKLLLADQRVDPSHNDNEAIRKASANDHLEIVKLLLADSRVDPSDYNNDAIRRSSRNGHLDVAMLLLADRRVDFSAIQLSYPGGF